MAYFSGISSVSNSSFTSFGSNDSVHAEPLQINSSVFLNNNITYGSRLEMLQQIANRVQRDCVNGEDKLALAWTALQSDAKRLESGIQFLHEAEIAGYLLECENILRQQVVDIQLLLDGRFPFADQLVQRVSKLRDDLLTLRAECSSVYSQGRTLTTEQTKMMISGITQSLNSGFSQNMGTNLTPALTPALTPGGIATPGSPFTSSLTPCLTPSLTPGLQPPSVQCYMGSGGGGGGGGGMDPGSLRHLKHMQIRKPLLKSSLADPNMTEEEVNMKYVQDLLMWVEDMQVQLDRSEWGSDLPSVETHLDNHKSVHRAIEEFQMSLKDATLSEIQMTIPLKLSYSDKLNKLEKQYERLLSCSRERQSHLENLLDFVSQATQELIWLNEKEEEEVAFDWSDRNSNISKKRDYHADLMRELDEKEVVIKSVQDKAERLMFKNHPAKTTIEAYRAAMQTQWSWILQLCSCVERHLKENAVYFEYFRDAKESIDYLKSLQDAIQRKYSCDRTSSLHRLEDLIQESMDEKEQLLQYRSAVAGLVGRAKNIVQLRPRNPESPVRSSIPVKAICDYRQIEITIYKDDECVLASNSHRAKWKVINPAGNEAMVPSVCFTVPPPNKEAVDKATRTEQLYQNVLALWHHSHINMKSVVSWHYLMADVRAIRNWNVASIKTMLPGEHQQVLSNMQSHFDEFLEDSEESEVFTVADCAQLEGDVTACKEYYQELLRSAEREEHEESVYNNYISEIRNFRMHLEAHEEHLIRQIRTPLERDDLEQSLQRITEHERKTAELNKVKEDLDVMKEKCELFLRQAAGSSSVPTLSSELTVLVQSMSQVYSMSSIYMDKLKTVSLVVKHSQSAEALVKAYESKLYEEDAMNSEVKSIETVISTLKQWRTEIDEKQEVFHDMEDELQKARAISDRMFKAHNERDFDLDWHKEKADQLSERWQNIHSQIDCRLRDLDGIDKSLKHYRDSYSILDEWVREMEVAQLKAQENKPEDSKALAELLNKQKVLVAEIEQKQSRIDECQKYSEQYSSAIKDYELQLMTFRAMVDSQHKSPLKKRRMQSSSDAIQQEFMDLRTRYTALVTLMTQYVKFASETLKRTEDEERSVDEEKREHGDKVSKLLHWMKQSLNNDGNAMKDSNANTDASNKPQVSVEEMVTKKEQIAEALRATQMMLNKHSDKMTEEEREKAQEQLMALNQAYSELSQQCSDQTTSAEEDFKPSDRMDGLRTETKSPLTDQMTWNTLPEAQLMTCDALRQDLVYKPTPNHLSELNDAKKCIQSPDVSSVSLSDIAAAREGPTFEDLVMKMIEVKQVCDGVEVCYTGDTLTIERAFHSGLIPACVYVNILQRQKTCQEMINHSSPENVSLVEPEHEFEPCKVNQLILKCLSRNKPLTPGRNVSTLRSVCDGLSDQETLSRLLGAQLDADGNENGDRLKVDAAIQCDLMSSSSTLTVLGNQQQFMGLVLPHSGEIQTVSTSFHYHEQLTTNEYTSSLFSDRQKIAAFYIPENSEIVDIASAIENSLTDNYTTEVLKSIELPDVFPDVDHLYEKFSSWLMYKKLTVDGCHRAAESIKVDNIPSTTEARQMFISYLMMNSFIDPKSGQRVLILDRQLNETVKIFLEDLVLSENTENNVSSLTVTDVPEQLDIPLLINEETEGLMKNAQYTYDPNDFVSSVDGRINFNESTDHTFYPQNLVSSGNGKITFDKNTDHTFHGLDCVSLGNGTITFDENTDQNVDPRDFGASIDGRITLEEKTQHLSDPCDFVFSVEERITFDEKTQCTFDSHNFGSSVDGRITFDEKTQHVFDPSDFVFSVAERITFDEKTQHTCDPHDFGSSVDGRFPYDEDTDYTFQPHDFGSSVNGRIALDEKTQHFYLRDFVSSVDDRITFDEKNQHTCNPHDLSATVDGRIAFDENTNHTFDPDDFGSSVDGMVTVDENTDHTCDPHDVGSSIDGRIIVDEKTHHAFDPHEFGSSLDGRNIFDEKSQHTCDPHDFGSSVDGRISFDKNTDHTFNLDDFGSSVDGRITLDEKTQHLYDACEFVSSVDVRIMFDEKTHHTGDLHDFGSSVDGRITIDENTDHMFDPHDFGSSVDWRFTVDENTEHTFDPHDSGSSVDGRITVDENTEHTFDPHDFVSSVDGRIIFDEKTQHTFDPHDFGSSVDGSITFDEKTHHTGDLHDFVSSVDGRITIDENTDHTFDPHDFGSSVNWRFTVDENTEHIFDPHDFGSSVDGRITVDENTEHTFDPHDFGSSVDGRITLDEKTQHLSDACDFVSSVDGRIIFDEKTQHTFDPRDFGSSVDGSITFDEKTHHTGDLHDFGSSVDGRFTVDENTDDAFDPRDFGSSVDGRITVDENTDHAFDPRDFGSSVDGRITVDENTDHAFDPRDFGSSVDGRITLDENTDHAFDPRDFGSSVDGRITVDENTDHTFDPRDFGSSVDGRITLDENTDHTFDPRDFGSSVDGRITVDENTDHTFDPRDFGSSVDGRITLHEKTQHLSDAWDFVSSVDGRIIFDEKTQHTFDPHDFGSSVDGRITVDENTDHTFDPHDFGSSVDGRITVDENTDHTFDPRDFGSSVDGRITLDENTDHTFDPRDFGSSVDGRITVDENTDHTFDPRDFGSSVDGRITLHEKTQHLSDAWDFVSSVDGRIIFDEKTQHTFDPHDFGSSVDGRITVDENTDHTFDPHDFGSSVDGRITVDENTDHTFDPHDFGPSVDGRITVDENTDHTFDPQDFVSSVAGSTTFNDFEGFSDTTDPGVAEKNKKSGEVGERICANSLQTDVGGAVIEDLDIPASVVMSVFPILSSVKSTNVGSLSKMSDSECSGKSCSQTIDHFNAESVCSESRTIDTNLAEFLCSEDLVEERGILDVTSGRCYDMNTTYNKGLVDETATLKLRDLQSDEKGSVVGVEEGSMSVLKQVLSDESILSNIDLPTMKERRLFSSDCTVSIHESLQPRLVTDAANLDSKTGIYPEENCSQSISVDQNLGLININQAENRQGSTEQKVAAVVLDFKKEEGDKESESALDCVTRGNIDDEMSNYLHNSPPPARGHELPVISPTSWSQVTAECVHHTDKCPSLPEDTDSQVLINCQLTERADLSSCVMENAALTTHSRQSSLHDRTCNSNTDPENQTYHSCKPDSSPIPNDFLITGYNSPLGNQTLSKSDKDKSTSHCTVLSEESRLENDTVQSPLDNEPTPSLYYSSPRDLVESAITSVSWGDCNYDENIADDGSTSTLPQQAVLHSESDFSSGSEPRCFQEGQTSRPPVVSSEITTSDTGNHGSCDIKNSRHYTSTSTRVSLETLELTNNDSFDSKHSGADEAEPHSEMFSPESQHKDIFSHSEQISVSGNEIENAHKNDGSECCLNPRSESSNVNSGRSETRMKDGLGSVTVPDRNSLDLYASEYPQIVSDFLSDGSNSSAVASSAPAVFSNDVRTCVDDQEEMGTNVSDLSPTLLNTESPVAIVQKTQQPLGEGDFHERDMHHGLLKSSHSGLPVDFLEQSTPSLNNKEQESVSILQEERVHEEKQQSHAPNIQLQLLQVLKTVSPSQDLSMLQEVMETLNSALGGDSQEDRQHTLESIKEESSEGGVEGPDGHIPSPLSSADSDACKVEEFKNQLFSIQDFLECVGRLQDHSDVLDDARKDLLVQAPVGNNMEELQIQIEECECLESQLSRLAGDLAVDVEKAKCLLSSADDHIPVQIQQDLASIYLEVGPNLTAASQLCAEQIQSLNQALETERVHLDSMYQKHLRDLDELASLIQNDSEMQCLDLNTCDVDTLKHLIQQNKDAECNLLKETRLKLEDVTFDIQCFISEQAQFLSAAQSSCLLKLLSTTQRTLRDQTERLVAERSSLDVLLDTRERQNHAESLLERHKEFTEKLEEVCDNLTLTENRLIGHQQQTDSAESVTDLQQYQQEHQALQKDVLTNASALNEVITSTKKFLEENRNKLTPDQIAIAESKLEEAKSKAKLINQRAEESRKDLEKVVTTAIKQESEKAAAVERLEESKNKIEGLLDWISNIGSEKESGLDQTDHISKENGNLPEETSAKGLMGENDDANGNALQSTGNDFGREARGESDASLDLDKQYDRVKAHHQEILSQQQDLIMATQSAQALLDKQADVLSAEEKEKLQRNIQELKGRYEASLTQAEQQMKQVHCVQEELKKFQDDCEEFGGWLDQAEGEMEELGAPAGSLNILSDKLQRQKSFSEDVISHKGDLRFITISGQKVLDVAKACGLGDPAAKNAQLHVDTSGTCSAVKEKLDSAAGRYKTLHSQCNQLGNNLKDVVDKYKKYDDSSAGLLKWLNSSEEEARKQQSEAIAADPQTLQKQLEETKALQGQMTGHQTAVDTLRKTTESLVTCEGDLLSNPDEIQETVDDIVERYDNLSKSVSDRNEKLQITLTRSMSVQDGLDEMMAWMEGVEASVKEKGQIPLDSASIGDILSKEAALEQDIASRQSSISAMKDKVKKFAETADSSAAALLQSNMEALSQRFSDACDKHKQKVSQLEQLKEKVEQFETVAGKVQQFVVKRSQDLHETDGPGKTFNELSQLMQSTKAEMAEHASDVEKLQTLSKELSELSPDGNKAQIQSKMDNLLNIFTTFKDTVKEKEEEVSSCQDQLGEFRSAANALTKWLEETNEKVPAVQPSSSEKSLEKDLQTVTGLLDEWTSKGPAVQDLNSEGSALCSLITFLTSPAKTKTPNKSALTNGGGGGPASHSYLTNKELMVIQQNVSFVNEGYASLGETLKSRATELSSSVQYVKEAQKETADMMTWLKDMKKTAASWNNAATEKESVKTQLEQQKAFEDDMKQKQERHQKLREKLLNLIKTHPNSPEAAKWKQMLAEIDAAWTDISGSVEQRKQHLEQSNKNLDIFQTTELQLGQWLSEKELMMSVLGPLSIDLNMLKMQKQQVQILQNEFKSRKPQYEQLEEAASAILSSSGNQDPSNGKLVREKLAAITQKWQGITGQLDQRDSLIDQAVVKTGQFQELLRSLGHTASQLENQLTNHQGHSTQPDAVKKQLEDVHNISAQLREERKTLKEAEAINTELTAMVTEDYLKADLARQLESVSKPFKQLEEKAAKRIEQLNSTFASSQQFHQTSKDFQSWLGEKLQDQSKPQAISAKVDILHQTLEEHSKLQQALGEHEEVYNTILGEGEMLLQSTDGAEKLALQGQLTALSSNWDEVKRSSVEQAGKLQTALQRSLKYQEHAEKLSSWIQECEASEGRVKLTVDPAAVESSISQVKVLQKDVDKSRRLVEQLDTAADSLLEVANVDTQAVKEEKASIGKRVDNVAEGLQSKRESLEMISHTVKEFNDTYKEAKGQLERAKKQVDAYKSQGVQGHSNKNLTNMKAQHKSLEGVQNQIEHLKSMAKDLVVNVPDADGVTDLLLHTDSIENDYSSLNKILEETCQVLEGKLQGIGQFQISIREMYTHFTDLDDELDSMAPVDLDLATLSEQRGSIQSFVAKLQDLMANTANAGDSCKKMLETETSPDLLGLKRDLDALSKQCGKLSDRAKGREVQVQSTFAKLEELYGKLHRMEDELCRAVDKEATQGAVGMETDVINQQLEAFKAFQKEDIDPLQTQLQDINSLGQGLIQNAAKGTSTKKLDDDLEGVNTKWNTLNKKIAERSAQLHEALLHCGRFQDALESLLSWLTDTEELVANQKPPSAEFKVVKAQIQEQKLLQRLLDDRKPTVELIKKEGGKVAELAESVDKEKVAKEIECLGQRWDALLKKAENRHKQLESILVVTQQFHETLEPLSEWLAATEKHLANSEPTGTETSKLQDQICQHKALEEEIMNHSKDLFQAVSLGQVLRTVSSVDDKEFVQSKLDAAQASYIELQERCRRKAEMLQQALANARLFGEDEVALMNWLSEVHVRLGEVSVEDYKIDVLEKQLAEQRGLQSDIELRKRNVDQAISNGMELLKQTTGDEVVVIQGKLDGIKAKYAEINSMSDNVLKTLERVLSFSSKLHHNHEDLSSWLEKVEAEIRAFADQEPVGDQLIHAQSRQKALLKETKDQKPVMDKLNELSSSLLDLIPWHTREGLDKLVTDDNERYRAVCDTITQQVDQINADILKSQQFEQAADTELSWLTEAERKLLSMGEIRLEQDQNAAQLQAQKIFSMDVMRHKDAVDEIVKNGKAIMNSKNPEEKEKLKAKTQTLLEKYGTVSQLNSERCLQLERTQSLASQFWETYEEMWPWLQETLSTFSQLPPPSIEYDRLRQQQEELRQMRELIAEHKPHIDKMNKTGPQLLELSPVEGVPIREKYTATDQLYIQLKADVKQRAATLDEAISKSTQFHDKIDPMLESLERIAERLRQPPSISVEVDKIREQITENKAVYVDLEKLQPSYETLRQRGEEMIARSEGADKDIYAKAVQDQLDQMVFLWSDIQALLVEREAKLLDVMDLADKFWCDHCALIVTIKDSQDLLRELEEPGVDPSVVKQQQEFVEGFKEEIDGLQEELDVVQNQGAELMTACGEPDKPVIKKSIDEVNSAWENLNKTWKERGERLEEAMQAAVQFQDGLQGMFDWVDIMESKLDSMSPVGTDLETVKQQIVELKEFKGESYQLQIEMERLNHQAGLLLKKVTEEADRCEIQEPMSELRMLWENLDEKIISRQHKLEGGLLALGQFQHALDELLAWMSHTEELLDEQRKAGGDPKAIEIELAKHHVLQVDVLAHKATVETVNKAGTDLVESSAGEEAAGLQTKLENLNQRWKAIQEKTKQRKQQLESSLLQAQGFHGEIEDMQQWLKDTERQLLASKAVGGLPDTAREQLNAHLELCSALEAKEELCQELLNKGHQLLAMTPEGPDSNTEQDLANLREKWEAVQGKVAERKAKLEEALTLATDFHNSLQDFINWLTQAEQTLNMVSPASLILETIMFQIDEHKVFVTEVNSHREHIIELDKTGTHLKYFSQKQDVVLIKNLLLSVQGRWEKVVQRSVERGRLLDDSRKRAKQFHETWNKLMEWLDESEKTLDSEVEIANDPDKIKTQLAQHKEFQKALGSKHSVYDTTARTGRALKDKTSLQDDNQKLDDMLSELRDKWDTVCGKSVERQNKLEEALLFSGQFTDALQALIDWLYRVEPQLAEDQPVHGDIDLVLNLIDNHKAFQKELGKRTVTVQALKRSARELVDSSHADSSWVKVQMQELSTRWETVCNLSVSKQARLEQALCQAEEFHSTVHILLEWLAEAEQSLRFHGSLPDDEEALRALIEQHKEFMKKLEEKRVALNKATSMGEAILSICHPDSITTIKHWNTIIKARFDEVQAWARQHQQRLATALTEMLATQDLLENLLTWLQWAETNLNDKDNEPLPQELEEVKGLIAEHQAFMEEMTRKQPDVDTITKTHKRKAAVEPQIQSHIPVLEKGRTGRKRSPTQTMYASATQAPIETKNPRVNLLVTKWQHVWLLALDRRRKLNDGLDRLEELKEFANFDFDVWRKRYMRWMNHKKSRVMDFFRRIDKDQDGKVTRQEFIEGILSSKFPTSRLEMSAVADIFDRDGDGYIDYYEFVAALHPNKDAYKPLTDADKIEDEVTRQVAKCKCPKRFQVEQIGANKYRFYLGNQFGLVHCLHDSLIGDETIAIRENQNLTPHLNVAVLESCILFGDSQQLRLVRILRSTVMVRVGGGWMALDEFLVKNDPCRVHHHGSKMLRSESNSSITQSPIGWHISHLLSLLHEPESAKGRTNLELREKFILPEGTTQVMASFRYRGRRSRPSSRGASPNRSTSSQSCPVPPNPVLTSTPKTPQHITRNYDKPWLTNSKPSTPLKSSDSFESQGSSSEMTPVHGSKLRLPGYLSGKGFQSGEEGTLISAAVLKARTQTIGESRRNSSRPGSKAGSRGSSRRGSDASDFDISDIQSVCSDASETVGESARATPRSASRQRGGKPSKIPTPQRRTTPTSKLAKGSKR
ncbi:dystonin isoform X4 [Scophthalmus maximus]|uniref:dystonin isoform X4 n=1 Tax=Scophthalmus maximus TaxID=52904 RepID=UPI001FA8D0F8|nr:dystonin isoform X4 [Scophthalmus maximus]